MTDDQLKVLAELTLLNNERIIHLANIMGTLLEVGADQGAFGERANLIRSDAEQLAASSEAAAASLEKLRAYFGLSET